MSNPAENNASDAAELERLRAHNTQLLSELKTTKTKATDLQTQLSAVNGERDAALTEVRSLRLDIPVREMLEGIALPGTASVLAQLITARGYSFDLDGEQITIKDASGNPATVTDPPTSKTAPASKPRAAKFDADDLKLLMMEDGLPQADRHELVKTFSQFIVGSRARGGGSQGGAGGAPIPSEKPAPAPTPASAGPRFGLT